MSTNLVGTLMVVIGLALLHPGLAFIFLGVICIVGSEP